MENHILETEKTDSTERFSSIDEVRWNTKKWSSTANESDEISQARKLASRKWNSRIIWIDISNGKGTDQYCEWLILTKKKNKSISRAEAYILSKKE